MYERNSLEVNITLDGDVGAVDVGSGEGHVDVGGPRGVLPLHVDGIIRLDGGGEAVVVTEVTLPGDSELARPQAERGGDLVGSVNLLGDGESLLVLVGRNANLGAVRDLRASERSAASVCVSLE